MEIPGYRIEGILGRGAMGTVYLAVRELLQRQVALKVLAPGLSCDGNFRERFLKEGRIVAQLDHPRIVKVHDIGSHDGCLYMDLELAPGGSLIPRIREGLAPEEAIALTIEIADALAFAHRRDFVHRDVKPGNILFREDASPLLSDFGVAKGLGNETQLTAFGLSIGTPHYMSPEQGLGQPVTNRSDLYSLGVTFYEMLTGNRPYHAENPFALIAMHLNRPIPRLPEGLARFQPVIDRAMAKDPSDRFASGEELIAALVRASGDKLPPAAPCRQEMDAETTLFSLAAGSVAAAREGDAGERTTGASTDTGTRGPAPTPDAAAARQVNRPRRHLLAGALLLLAAAGSTGIWIWNRGQEPAPDPAPPRPAQAGFPLSTPEARIGDSFEAVTRVARALRDLDTHAPMDVRLGEDLAERLAFLVEQTLAAGDRAGARERLDQARALLPDSPLLAAIRIPPVDRPSPRSPAEAARIRRLLQEAEQHIRERRFTLPEGANALDSYRQVLVLDPENPGASAALEAMADILARKARAELEAGDHARAAASIEAGLLIRPGHQALRVLSGYFHRDTP